ncbi:type II toxin-antitoxin system RelE/ParE family toxin [Burkholderia cenocepacia]|nr:type II toxin-antitoxin system RelE/ParE family toxin [Burkholderia cenocepacia]
MSETPEQRSRTMRAVRSRDTAPEMIVRANYIVVYTEDPFTVRILRVLHAAQQWPPGQD